MNNQLSKSSKFIVVAGSILSMTGLLTLISTTSKTLDDFSIYLDSLMYQTLSNKSEFELLLTIKHTLENSADYIFITSICVLAFVGIVSYVVSQKIQSIENKLSYSATHDALTNIYNRNGFSIEIKNLISHITNTDEHTILFLDLDRFKIVNDTCGHAAGDELLRTISTKIKECIRQHDVIARLGGDEFGIILTNCKLSKAQEIAQIIIQTCREFDFIWNDKLFKVTTSIGIATITNTSKDMDKIMMLVDDAMYKAKQNGRDQMYYLNLQDSGTDFVHKNELTILHEAISEKRFVLYTQFIKPMNGDIDYYEILVRMIDDNNGLIMPEKFIGLAEKYKLMSSIDYIVMEKLFQNITHIGTCIDKQHFAVNISGDTINKGQDFVNWLSNKLAEYKISPSSICFEVTETVAIANFDQAKLVIQKITDLGCQFALDDFGTGISSLTYLKELPFTLLKIDGYFIKDMMTNHTNIQLVKAINDISHILGMKTIAEYVGDDEIINTLKKMNIDYIQGYGIDKPKDFFDVFDKCPIS